MKVDFLEKQWLPIGLSAQDYFSGVTSLVKEVGYAERLTTPCTPPSGPAGTASLSIRRRSHSSKTTGGLPNIPMVYRHLLTSSVHFRPTPVSTLISSSDRRDCACVSFTDLQI